MATKEIKGLLTVKDKNGDLNIIYPVTNAGSVDGLETATASKDGLMSKADKTKLDGIAAGAQKNTVTGIKGNSETNYRTGNINITPANIGLGNVNNTSDANKPVSAATQTELNKKANSTELAKYLPLTGGLLSGATAQISKDTISSSGVKGRDNALIRIKKYGGYSPIASLKTEDGSWEIGVYTGNKLYFSYITDENYNAENNITTKQYTFNPSTGIMSGIASFAQQLQTARTIDGVSFNGTAAINHFGTCQTAAATVEKAVACTGFTLVTGAEITILFTVTNTAANATLNVNSTGAKPIYYRNAAISAGYLAANRIYKFVYDGAQYELIGDINVDTNTTYSNMTAATASAAGKSGLVPAPAAGKQSQFLRGDGTWAAPTNTTYAVATENANGLLSKEDKAKLNKVDCVFGIDATGPYIEEL